MRIAIVGANGYLARNLLRVAVGAGHEVLAYDLAGEHADGHPSYMQADLTDRSQAGLVDLSVDAVYMMAGKTGTSAGFDDYGQFVAGNELTLLNLLDAMRASSSRARLIFPSTRLVYRGRPEPLEEGAPKEAKTVYAANKLACEAYLEQWARAFGIDYTVLRICVPFGTLVPGAASYGTAEFMLTRAKAGQPITLFGDGSLRRTFTHAADICEALLRAGKARECAGGTYNVGGHAYSLLQVAKAIASLLGVGIEHVPWPEMALALETGDTVFDDSRLAQAIGSIEYGTLESWLASAEA